MKKTVLLGLLIFLLTVLPAAGTDELTGTWIGFATDEETLRDEGDFTILRFSADGSELTIIETDGDKFSVFTGKLREEGEKFIFESSDGGEDEISFRMEEGNLIVAWDWRDERAFIQIDDSYFPEDPENSPFIGPNRIYWIARAEDGGIRLLEYLGDEETVEIPAEIFGIPVTAVDDYAICFKEEMRHLILSDGVRTIGYHAFEEDNALEDVRLPNTLESLGSGAFMYCYNLQEVVIPEGVKVIEDGTFWQCISLTHVVLPESIGEIHPDAFHGNEATAFTVKQGSYAEQFCQENGWSYAALDDESWSRINTEEPTQTSDSADGDAGSELAGSWIRFQEDEDIIIFRFSPDGSELSYLNNCGYYPERYAGTWKADGSMIRFREEGFDYDDELPYFFADGKLHLEWRGTEFVLDRIDDSLYPEDIEASPYFGENREFWTSPAEDGTIRFDAYSGTAETVTVPDNVFGFPVTSIVGGAFESNSKVKHVIIPSGVTFIGAQAFAYADSLESVQLPDTLERIGYAAFEYCHSLKEIIIPEGVTRLEVDTFWGCENLTSVVLPSSLEEIDENGAFENTEQILFTVKQGSFAEKYCQENGLTYMALGDENWSLIYPAQ